MINFKSIIFCALIGMFLTGAVYADPPPTYTAYDLQTYNGVHEGDRVRFIGVVSVESARYGYSVTVGCDESPVDPSGEYNGIAIYDIDQRLAAERGDLVDVVGILTEYYDKTEIVCSDETEFPPVVIGTGSIPGPFDISCTQADSEPYESVLIRLTEVEVLTNPDQYGAIAITCGDEGHEFTLLLRLIDPPPAIGYVYATLTGDDDYHFGEFKIRPRDEGDWGDDPVPTPTGGPNPTPTPTGGPTCSPSMTLEFNGFDSGHCFSEGENFHPLFKITNECPADWQVDFYLVLQVANAYFFYPHWSEDWDHGEASVRSEGYVEGDVLPAFNWPSIDGHFNGLRFFGVMTVPEVTDANIGNVPILDFCY